MNVKIKRVYERQDESDGIRILVDRLWPRGLTKEKAAVDIWMKEIAPTTELRKWFGHDPKKWREFKRRYLQELKGNHEVFLALKDEIEKSGVTLLYGSKDETHNEAQILLEELKKI